MGYHMATMAACAPKALQVLRQNNCLVLTLSPASDFLAPVHCPSPSPFLLVLLSALPSSTVTREVGLGFDVLSAEAITNVEGEAGLRKRDDGDEGGRVAI